MAQIVTININVIGHISVVAYAQDYNIYDSSYSPTTWISGVNFSSSYGALTFTVANNAAVSTRYAYIHLFGNYNNTSLPDLTIQVQQTESTVNARVTNYDVTNGALNSFENLDSTSVFSNGGPLSSAGVNNALFSFNVDTASPFSDLVNGNNSGGGQITTVSYFDENGNFLSTQNDLLNQSGGQWLEFTNTTDGVVDNFHTANFNVPVNPPGNGVRKAVLTFRHPTIANEQDTVTIEQARGYDPTLDTVDVLCEETIPQTFISAGTPTVGTTSGNFSSKTQGVSNYNGNDFLIEHDQNSVLVEYLVKKNGSTLNTPPLVSIDSVDHDIDFPNTSSLPVFANMLNNNVFEPNATQSSYNYYNTIQIDTNNTYSDRVFRIKAHHPDNSMFPAGSDGFMRVIQKAYPSAWFDINGAPSNLTYTGSQSATYTNNQAISSSAVYTSAGSGTGAYSIPTIQLNGSALDGIVVRTSSNKAPLVKVAKFGHYSSNFTAPGPGFPSQLDFPGSLWNNGTSGFAWTGGAQNQAGYAVDNDFTIWPFNGDGGLVQSVKYKSYTNTSQEYDYGDFCSLPITQQLDDQHSCTVKVNLEPPSSSDRKYFALGVWHFTKVDYSDPINPIVKPSFEEDPDQLLWFHQNTATPEFTLKNNNFVAGPSVSGSVLQLPTRNIVASGGSGFIPNPGQNAGNWPHSAFTHSILISGVGLSDTNVNVYFYTAYHTNDFSPATIDNLTPLTGATTVSSGSTWGSASVAVLNTTTFTWNLDNTGVTNTWQNSRGIHPVIVWSNSSQLNNNLTQFNGNSLPIVNESTNNDIKIAMLLPDNDTGQVRKLRVVVESAFDTRHRIFQDIIQSA